MLRTALEMEFTTNMKVVIKLPVLKRHFCVEELKVQQIMSVLVDSLLRGSVTEITFRGSWEKSEDSAENRDQKLRFPSNKETQFESIFLINIKLWFCQCFTQCCKCLVVI